jgi:hypothetical protein
VCNHLPTHRYIATMSSAEGNNLVFIVVSLIRLVPVRLVNIHRGKLEIPVNMSLSESQAIALQYTERYMCAFSIVIILQFYEIFPHLFSS